jgi:signal transduction histidine kinase
MTLMACKLFNEGVLELVNKMLGWHDRKIRLSVLKKQHMDCVMPRKFNRQDQPMQPLEQQRLEIESLQNQLRQERELRAMRENFTAMIAHEFGTPLSIIRAKSSLLGNHTDRLSKPQLAQYTDNIEVQINYMLNLLDDLVFINRSNNTQCLSQQEPIELIPFCTGLLEQITHQWGRHEVVLTTSGTIETVILDRRVVQYTLSNLLSNAFKYSPAGRDIRLDIQDDGQFTIFSITDQGMGIPDTELDKIFTPFYRASNAHEFNGTGLGLAVVKTSVEAYGGSIKVESKLGEGTTFVVTLPHGNS